MEDLYQQLILDYAKNNKRRGSFAADCPHAAVDNPLCGDSIVLWLKTVDGQITDVRFDGHGCVISQAAAAIMAELIVGKSSDEAIEIQKAFKRLLEEGEESAVLGDLTALGGVREFPARIRCALLGFEALDVILKTECREAPPSRLRQ